MSILNEFEKKYTFKPVKIAEMLGMSKSYYSMVRNSGRPISRDIAIKLRDVFGVKLDDLLCPVVHATETEKDLCIDNDSPKSQAS